MTAPLLLALLLATPADPTPAPTPEAEARALLDDWLRAQNYSEFSSYQRLYAADFLGVRRSGDKVATFDRDGWFRDRAPMFARKMVVAAEAVRVFAKPAAARVVFTQEWSSPSYSDVGTKQLILRREEDGYRIVREELFSSKKRARATELAQFAFVLEGELVLATDPDEEAWAAGPPVLEPQEKDSYLNRSRRPVDVKKLPPALAKLAGTRVRLLDARGPRCEATVGAFHLRGRVMMGTEDAAEAWSSSSVLLVAKLVGDAEACKGATWARAAALPVPPLVPAVEADAKLRARALGAFRRLAAVKATQRQYRRWSAEHPGRREAAPEQRLFAGEDHWADGPVSVLVMRSPGGPTLLSVTVDALGLCNDFQATMWALWQLEGPPGQERFVLRNHPDAATALTPAAAVDVDGDGRPELLFDGFADHAKANASGQPETIERGIVRPRDGRYVNVDGPILPIYICPC